MQNELIETLKRTDGRLSTGDAAKLLKAILSADEVAAGRILRGHTKTDCLCRYCKSVLSNRIVLNEGVSDNAK